MKRIPQFVLIGSFLPLSWLGMMIVHELGHVLGAWLTGGTVSKVVLHPLVLSRTDLGYNPHPLLVVWAGPLIGTALPAVALGSAYLVRFPGRYLVRFFAGFCLIANGIYLTLGSFDGVGDTGDILRYGGSLLYLWLFGIVAVPLGFYLWHGIGPSFGLGDAKGQVDRAAVLGSLILFTFVVVVEIIFDTR